jgi:nicotinamidase-related amidase
MAILDQKTALVIIDVQQGFDDPIWGERNNPQAEENIARLLMTWRVAGRPVFHVQHMSREPNSPLRPGQAGNSLKESVKPTTDEPLIQKQVNSAFIGTDLEDRLRAAGIQSLVIVGLTTNHCVSTTARMAGNLGFQTIVVADATAAFNRKGYDGKTYTADEVHAVSLANLHEEFAAVVSTAELL